MFSSTVVPKVQKQPPEVFCKKSCSLKFRNIYRKTPVLDESLFNKVALVERCFPVNMAIFVRTPILKNICERLLL